MAKKEPALIIRPTRAKVVPKTNPKTMGRPKIIFDDIMFAELKLLIISYATQKDLEDHFQMSRSTMERALKKRGVTFEKLFQQKRVATRTTVRAALLQQVKEGNTTAIIWASKQWCGMTDKVDIESPKGTMTPVGLGEFYAKTKKDK